MDELSGNGNSDNESFEELKRYTGVVAGEEILIYATSNVSPHFETSIEIAVLLSKLGCKVTYIFAGHKIPGFSYYNKFARTRYGFSKDAMSEFIAPTMSRVEKALGKYIEAGSSKIDIISPKDIRPPRVKYRLPVTSIGEIRNLTFRGCISFGQSIAGSICAIAGKDVAELDGKLLGVGNSLAESYIVSYYVAGCIESFCKKKFDAVLVFNGRFPWIRGAEQHFKEVGCKMLYHERGPSKDRYYISTVEPQKRINRQLDCKSIWERCGASDERLTIGKSFFEAQRAGSDQNWTSFSQRQKPGLSGKVIEDARLKSSSGKVVVYFTSSENELLAMRDFWNRGCNKGFEWKNQRMAIAFLAQACSELGHGLIIRIHPHMAKKTESVREEWDNMSFLSEHERDFISLIPSGSRISSYELIDQSDFVVAQGSTIGIEAVYWNKKSILMGHSFYDEIGVTLSKAYTYKDLLFSLSDEGQFIVDPDSCLIYGYYMKMHGVKHCIYKPATLFSGYI